MTREEAIKWKKEIYAFQQGKTIEILDQVENKWIPVSDPFFSLDREYRIAPEPRPTKYRPFKFGEITPGNIVRNIETQDLCSVIYVNSGGLVVGRSSLCYNELLQYYTFFDGSPCGVKEAA